MLDFVPNPGLNIGIIKEKEKKTAEKDDLITQLKDCFILQLHLIKTLSPLSHYVRKYLPGKVLFSVFSLH